MESPVQARYQYGRKIRHAMGRRDVERNKVVKRVSHVPRKASSVNYTLPVPQTDTGSRGE